jgi:hypothetical protein
MGAGDFDALQPNNYPMVPTWHNVIAPVTRFRLQPTQFPPRNWNPDILSLVTLGEFAATDWHDPLDPGPPPDDATTSAEVDYLVTLAQTQRESRMSEILAHIQVIISTTMGC